MSKKKMVLIEYSEGLYYKEKYTSKYLSLLSEIFLDCSFEKSILKRLLTPNSKGITGNATVVVFEGEKVIINPAYFEDECPEDEIIDIDRNFLLRLINRWLEVIKSRPTFITLTLEDDGEISVTGSTERPAPTEESK